MPSADGLITAQEAVERRWDLVVIGTGVGGSTFGGAAAAAGLAVLFVERGRAERPVVGRFAEELADGRRPEHDVLASAGREDRPLIDASGRRARAFVPFVGAGPGGSSSLYGMAMERFFPSDFTPQSRPSPDSDGTVARAWPFEYEDLAPWYDVAERRFSVRGERDPLRPQIDTARATPLLTSTPLQPLQRWLGERLADAGLHPYRLPLAGGAAPDCRTCQGYLCAQGCKVDAWKAWGRRATERHGARLLAASDVVRLNHQGSDIESIECRIGGSGESVLVRGRQFALAAGAIRTPLLLLRSADRDRPHGVGNGSGWVGRGLMRHALDLHAIRPPKPWRDDVEACAATADKAWAFNDLYEIDGVKLGSVQSFGRLPPAPVLFESLRQDLRDLGWASPAAALLPVIRPLLAPTLDDLAERRLILAATLEDSPHSNNRIELGSTPDLPPRLHYRLPASDRQRLRSFRRELGRRLRGFDVRTLAQADNNQRLAHVCGTCRMGDDPSCSVTDLLGRVRGIDNAFVVDASLFPSSGGTNPSLTIAANALRMAAAAFGKMPPDAGD